MCFALLTLGEPALALFQPRDVRHQFHAQGTLHGDLRVDCGDAFPHELDHLFRHFHEDEHNKLRIVRRLA